MTDPATRFIPARLTSCPKPRHSRPVPQEIVAGRNACKATTDHTDEHRPLMLARGQRRIRLTRKT
jgi:hypothetical protein